MGTWVICDHCGLAYGALYLLPTVIGKDCSVCHKFGISPGGKYRKMTNLERSKYIKADEARGNLLGCHRFDEKGNIDFYPAREYKRRTTNLREKIRRLEKQLAELKAMIPGKGE